MRTIIHVGQHKTGTTSIQHYLKINSLSLKKNGLYVPLTLSGFRSTNHCILNVYALNKDRHSPMKDKLLGIKNEEYINDLGQRLTREISQHYQDAEANGCKDVIWSNEGLYLLNSIEEYKRLINLFTPHSSEIVCICCFRERKEYRKAYINQLIKKDIEFSEKNESYQYINSDSWLFNYERKEELLRESFQKVIFFPYNNDGMVQLLMDKIGYIATDGDSVHLNKTEILY